MKLLRINSPYQKVQRQSQMQKFKETGLSVAKSGVHVDPLGKKICLKYLLKRNLEQKADYIFWFKLPLLLHQKYLNERFLFLEFLKLYEETAGKIINIPLHRQWKSGSETALCEPQTGLEMLQFFSAE